MTKLPIMYKGVEGAIYITEQEDTIMIEKIEIELGGSIISILHVEHNIISIISASGKASHIHCTLGTECKGVYTYDTYELEDGVYVGK